MAIRVLVAEDFQLLREDLCETLSAQEDIEVVGQAASGAEIVRLARETEFDIILMDIEMESTTAGIRATEAILQEKPDSVIIFLTAHETDEMILLSMGAGAADYIVKGISDEEILRHLRLAAKGEGVERLIKALRALPRASRRALSDAGIARPCLVRLGGFLAPFCHFRKFLRHFLHGKRARHRGLQIVALVLCLRIFQLPLGALVHAAKAAL